MTRIGPFSTVEANGAIGAARRDLQDARRRISRLELSLQCDDEDKAAIDQSRRRIDRIIAAMGEW